MYGYNILTDEEVLLKGFGESISYIWSKHEGYRLGYGNNILNLFIFIYWRAIMKYKNVVNAVFLKRPNRFTAHVLLNGIEEIVHVKNTGRCREILTEGTQVVLEKAENMNRKTAYSLICSYKGSMLINIDSQVPNAVVFEGIRDKKVKEFLEVSKLKREVVYGNSRFDIYFETPLGKGFVEVKGVTLEEGGIAMFPDAPTERGTKHVNEMVKAVQEGYRGYIFFLIQLRGAKHFTPYEKMDKEFASALKNAQKKGVKILAYDSLVTENEITIGSQIKVVI
jgi:sugar fermentation stimulation protein A